jgi:hypothetical protein
MRHAAGSDRRHDLAPRPALSIEDDLHEWARWLRQGDSFGTGYPSESSTEGLAIPFRRAGTTDEQLEDFMASRAADELVGQRIDSWVSALHEPWRVAIQMHYVYMPESSRWANLTVDAWNERRARQCAIEWTKRTGISHTMDVDRYEAALSLAMDLLQDHEKRRAGGV